VPFKSQSQRNHFYATPKLHKFIDEFEAATPKGTTLPVRVGKKRKKKIPHARGSTHYTAITHALSGVKGHK
jgi:hypothetical protein